MKRSALVVGAVTGALLIAVASASAAVPTVGAYHGVVNGTIKSPCGGNEGEGFFRLRSTGKIAPLGRQAYCGGTVNLTRILVPSNFTCNQLNANLSVATIPVDANGAFVHTEDAPIGPGGASRTVTFRGRWATATRVTGTTRIRGGGCDHTDRWTMRKL